MKKLAFALVFMLCLTFPTFAGHTLPGDWCECGSFAACICDPGEQPIGPRARKIPNDSKHDAPVSVGSETLLVLGLLLLLFRYKS